MPGADIAASGSVWVALEDTYGTVKDPSVDDTDFIEVPIINETLMYTEPNRYYSEQIRNEAVHSDVKQSYYHVEGEIVMEVDAQYLPFFMAASRHTTTQVNLAEPFLYSSVPSKVGATYPGGSSRGLSVGIIRNAVGFLYSGVVVSQWAFTLENGIGRVTMTMLGLAEVDMDDVGALEPSFADPSLFGADAHAIYVDDSSTDPAFATPDATFNGYTFTANHNGDPQNRVVRNRSATYIKYGITEVGYDTELDFISRDEYDNFKNLTFRAIRFESIKPGGDEGTWDEATEGYRITVYRSNYATYEVGLSGMGDLVMAKTTGRGLAISGGSAYNIECLSTTDLALPPLTT